MLQSFFVYLVFGLSLFILGKCSFIRERNNALINKTTPFWVWDVVLALLIFAFVSGVRWNVGVDHQAYLNNYLSIQRGGPSMFDKEFGFEFITRLFAETGFHFSFYFGFLAFLQLFFIFKVFKNERYLYPFLGIVIIFGPEYLSWMNGMRQMLVATIFVWAIQFIQRRELYKYVITIVVSGLMHKSALLLIIFYFIPQRDYFKNRTFTFILVGISFFLNKTVFGVDNLKWINNLLGFFEYDWYSENLGLLIKDNQVRNIGPRRLSIVLTALVTIWYSPKLKNKFASYTNFITYYNLAIIGFLLYNLLGNMHHIFIRPLTYLTIFSVVTTAYLLVYLKGSLGNNYVVFSMVLFIVLSYLPLSIVAENGKGKKDYANYRFYWYQKK